MEGEVIPPRVRDITGQTINTFKVLSFAGKNNNTRPNFLWNVECPCGRILQMTKTSLNKNVSGCGSCLNPTSNTGLGLLVDVSTNKYPNTFTLVDIKDKHLFEKVRWYAYVRGGKHQKSIYVRTNSKLYSSQELHRVINNTVEGLVTDHISGDTLDNRSVNMRSVTSKENSKNCQTSINNTTGCLGVSKTPKGKYRAYITIDGSQIHLGHFEDYEDAVTARKHAEDIYGFHSNHGRK